MAMALFADDPESHWNPGQAESNVVATALMFLLCIMSEIEVAAGYQRHPKLLELWSYLRDTNGEVKGLWSMRYEALLSTAADGQEFT
jgi:hypothetical protein